MGQLCRGLRKRIHASDRARKSFESERVVAASAESGLPLHHPPIRRLDSLLAESNAPF
jgi:hypothetical protein